MMARWQGIAVLGMAGAGFMGIDNGVRSGHALRAWTAALALSARPWSSARCSCKTTRPRLLAGRAAGRRDPRSRERPFAVRIGRPALHVMPVIWAGDGPRREGGCLPRRGRTLQTPLRRRWCRRQTNRPR